MNLPRCLSLLLQLLCLQANIIVLGSRSPRFQAMFSSSRQVYIAILFVSCLTTGMVAQDFLSARVVTPSQLPTGSGILAAGDLNGDGIDDIVYGTSGGLGVAFGSASGFTSPRSYPAVSLVREVTISDVNGDGKSDLVVGLAGTPTGQLAVLLNNGDGTFGAPIVTTLSTSTPSGTYPVISGIAVGDFDGDKTPDIVVSDIQNYLIYVLHGNGDGTFRVLNSTQDYNPPSSRLTADLNHDGKLDIVGAEFLAATVVVRLGNGDGTFQPAMPLSGTYNYSPVLADVDGDGIQDLVIARIVTSGNPPNQPVVVVFHGNNDGTFTETSSYPYSSTIGQLLAIRDLDGDGKPDLILATPNGFVVITNRGGGQFAPPITFSTPYWGSGGSAVGDFDGDGRLDIIGSITYSNALAFVLKGYGGTQFNGALTLDLGGMFKSGVASDLNGDGNTDIVVDATNGTTIYLGNGDGTFKASNDASPLGDQLLLNDFDGDGIPDLLYVPSSAYGNAAFRHGKGDGTFNAPVNSLSLYHGASSPVTADLNGDGKLDLIAWADGALNVWSGNGDGSFASSPVFYNPSTATSTGYCNGSSSYAYDLHGSTSPDILATSNGFINLFTNARNGTGALTLTSTYPGCAFVLTDVNNDNKIDLVSIQPSQYSPQVGTTIAVQLGDGTGTFGTATTFTLNNAYPRIMAADLDHDGKMDLILSGADAVAVLNGDGAGGFGAERRFLAGDDPQTALVADLNSDGAPDLIFGNSSGASPAPNSLSILLNRDGSRASLSYTANPAQYGEPIQLVASVKPTVIGSMTPSGTVDLTFDQVALPLGTLTNGTYSYSLGTLAVGTHVSSGNYSGDSTFRTKTFAPVTLTVTKADTTIAVSPSANPALYGTDVTLNLRVQPAYSGTPSGTITVAEGGAKLLSANLDGSGRATLSLSGLSVGSHALTVTYSGDSNFVASTASVNESVKYSTSIAVDSSLPVALVGSSVTLTATVSSRGGNPSGSVTFTDGNSILGHAAILGGKSTFIIANLQVGPHSITASYAGDAMSMASSSTAIKQDVTDFSIAAQNASLIVNAGRSGGYTLNLAALDGFSGTVALSCAGAPALSTCSISPASVTLNGNTTTATLSVATTGPTAALRMHDRATFAVFATWTFGFLCIVIAIPTGRGWLLYTAGLLVLALTTASCGGGSKTASPQQTRTPIGTSTLIVTATTASGGVNVTHQLSLTLTVN